MSCAWMRKAPAFAAVSFLPVCAFTSLTNAPRAAHASAVSPAATYA